MGQSRMQYIVKKLVSLTHVCSNCHFPVVSLVVIEARAIKGYMFVPSNATEAACEAATLAANNTIQRINNLYKTKEIFEPFIKEMVASADSCSVHVFSEGNGYFYSVCPYCGKIEPWLDSSLKREIAEKEIAKLPRESFPTVYRDFKEASIRAEVYVKRKIEDIERKRENTAIVEQAKNLFYQTKPKVESLNNRIQSIPEYIELESKKRQIQELQSRKEKTGAFNFKEKKEIKKSIEKLSAEVQELIKSVDVLKNPLDKELQKEKEILDHNQLLAFGCNPEVSLKQINASFCFYYVPNNPPPEPKPSIKEEVITKQIIESSVPTNDNGISNNVRKPMFCHKCGAKLLANSSFCSFCGAKLE